MMNGPAPEWPSLLGSWLGAVSLDAADGSHTVRTGVQASSPGDRDSGMMGTKRAHAIPACISRSLGLCRQVLFPLGLALVQRQLDSGTGPVPGV